MKVSEVQKLQNEINAKYPGKMVCDLPDHEFDLGGLVWDISTKTGHHSGRATIGGLSLWGTPASNLLRNLH